MAMLNNQMVHKVYINYGSFSIATVVYQRVAGGGHRCPKFPLVDIGWLIENMSFTCFLGLVGGRLGMGLWLDAGRLENDGI